MAEDSLPAAGADDRADRGCPVAIDLSRDQSADLRVAQVGETSMAVLVSLIVSHFAMAMVYLVI